VQLSPPPPPLLLTGGTRSASSSSRCPHPRPHQALSHLPSHHHAPGPRTPRPLDTRPTRCSTRATAAQAPPLRGCREGEGPMQARGKQGAKPARYGATAPRSRRRPPGERHAPAPSPRAPRRRRPTSGPRGRPSRCRRRGAWGGRRRAPAAGPPPAQAARPGPRRARRRQCAGTTRSGGSTAPAPTPPATHTPGQAAQPVRPHARLTGQAARTTDRSGRTHD
jgi:hypothetical protein